MKQTQTQVSAPCQAATYPGLARLKVLMNSKNNQHRLSLFALFAAVLSFFFLQFAIQQKTIFASFLRIPATYLNISTSAPTLDFHFNQSELSSSAFKDNTLTVSVQTDNVTGTTTYISSVDEETSLKHSDTGITDKIESISSPLLSTAFTGKTWGYRLNSLATTPYNPIPKASSPSEILSTNSFIPAASTVGVNFGVKSDPTLHSGTYFKQILFTAVTNYVQTVTKFLPGPAFNSILKNINPNQDTEYFKRSPVPLADFSSAKIVSTADSEHPIYMWYQPADKTIYWWTAADIAYMNEDGSSMFSQINFDSHYMKEVDASGINTSKTTNMSHMFYYDKPGGLSAVKIDGFNTSNVTDMSYMFSMYNYKGDQSNSPDFSTFDTSKVTNMEHMFDGSNFYHIDVSTFDTSNVTNMVSMFTLNQRTLSINVSNFNTKKVTDMTMMFSYCESITSLDLSSFRNDAVISMYGMFFYDENLTSLNLTGFNTEHVKNMTSMFGEMKEISNLNLTGFNTSQVTDMAQMFTGMKSIKNLDLSSFDTSKVTRMAVMFAGMDKIENLNLSSFDTRNVTDMNSMFSGIMKDVANGVLDLSSFNTQSLYDSSYMFHRSKVKTIYVSSSFTNTSIDSSTYMFFNTINLVGGNGTTYSPSNPTNKTYARIDAPGTPGYFTLKP